MLADVRTLIVSNVYPIMDRFLPAFVVDRMKFIGATAYWRLVQTFKSLMDREAFESRLANGDLAGLENGLDETSRAEIGLFVERTRNADQKPLPDQPFEISESRRWHEMLPAIKNKIKLPVVFNNYVPEVMMYHNGLAVLPEAAQRHLAGKDFLDIGAFIGDSAMALLDYKPRKIYSFDMSKHNMRKFQRTMDVNGVPAGKVEFILAGVGDAEGSMRINDDGNAGTSLGATGGNEVKIVSVDSFSKSKAADMNIGFIKADVEGYGMHVVKGMVETMRNSRPALAISIYHNVEEFFDIKPFIENLNLNYKFKVMKLNPTTCLSELTLIAYPAEFDAVK